MLKYLMFMFAAVHRTAVTRSAVRNLHKKIAKHITKNYINWENTWEIHTKMLWQMYQEYQYQSNCNDDFWCWRPLCPPHPATHAAQSWTKLTPLEVAPRAAHGMSTKITSATKVSKHHNSMNLIVHNNICIILEKGLNIFKPHKTVFCFLPVRRAQSMHYSDLCSRARAVQNSQYFSLLN